MACAAYVVDRTLLRRRGIVPVLEEKRTPRALAVIENIPMPRLASVVSEEGKAEEMKPEMKGVKGVEMKQVEVKQVEVKEVEVKEVEVKEVAVKEVEVKEEREPEEVSKEPSEVSSAPAGRLPKPTGVQSDGKLEARAKSSGRATRPAKFTQPLRRPRSTEKALRQARRAKETRDNASSPISPMMSPISLHSESLGGLLKELGAMREDYITCKLEAERAREHSLQLERENLELKRALAESEQQSRRLLHEKQEQKHLETLWKQRFEDSQRHLEDGWKRFDALQAAIEREKTVESPVEAPREPEARPLGGHTPPFASPRTPPVRIVPYYPAQAQVG